MDRAEMLKHQQVEFFLLYNLLVEEFGVLKRTKRMTPAKRPGYTVRQNWTFVTRLFRSFLEKTFPKPFSISKRNYYQEFQVSPPTASAELLKSARDLVPDIVPSLQPEGDEIGKLRFDFPWRLTIRLGSRRQRRSRWDISNAWDSEQIGQYCPAAKATLSWKARFDSALAEAGKALSTPKDVEKLEPENNQAQDQLEAVIRAAKEAGRL